DPVPCEPASTSPFTPSTPAAPPAPEVLSGLAVTAAHYLVVGSPATNSLLIFDLHTGGAPSRVTLPEIPGTPTGDQAGRFDMAPLPGGGLLLLDRGHKNVWQLDNTFRPVPPRPASPSEPLLFQSSGAGEDDQRTAPADLTPEPIGLADAIEPVSVEPLPDGTFLILDRDDDNPSIVRRYALTGAPALVSVQLVESNLRETEEPTLELDRIVGHDFAFVPEAAASDGISGTLYVVDAGGNQAFALSLTAENGLTLRARRAYFPLRGHTGKALVAPPGASQAFFDRGERWLPVVTLGRSRYSTNATLDLPVLDGREPDCTWHRLCLDACIPPETAVRVLTRAADEQDDLELQPWRAEPAPYLRGAGAEIPYYRLWRKTDLGKPSTGTWELLFQHARGRFLAVRLELAGNGRHTPVIRALRAHYPRFSYLTQYLPGVYQDDRNSAHFLETFLANPEGLLTTLEGQIAAVETHFDVRTTSSEAVDWLAGWLGLVFDPSWSDYQRRLLLAYAPVFYRRRGTLTGLVQ
ncbi:MAG TPA: phage tail protein, partial [Chloroflexota bacterium]|nr:phage tail protein [Chloroflexota bacterium]